MWTAVAGVVALGIAGSVAEPHITDWWVARSACGGVLPEGVLDVVDGDPSHDEHLYGYEESAHRELGRYRCEVKDGGDGRGYRFTTEAFTRRDDIDARLAGDFNERESARLALPGGLPGYESRSGDLVVARRCPDLGADGAGNPRKLHVRSHVPGYQGDQDSGDVSGVGEVYEAALRSAVASSNEASRRLSCGATPMDVPGNVSRPEPMPLEKTEGTPCRALARASLPKGGEWAVDVRTSDRAPVGSCSVTRPGTTGKEGAKGDGREVLDLAAFYGDWSKRMWMDTGRSRPWLAGNSGWATARCHGEDAAFRIRLLDGEERPALDAKQMRSLLADFAEEQAERRDCTSLRMPGRAQG